MRWLSLGPLCGPNFCGFFFSVFRVALGPGMGLAGCGGALGPQVVCSTGPSGTMVPVGLALCCFVVCSTGRFVLCLALCCFVLAFFGPFGIVIASLGCGWGWGRLVLVLFVRLFDLRLFGFVCFLFLLVSGKGCGL